MQLKPPHLLLSALLSLALLLGALSPAQAQSTAPGLELQAEAAFEGYLKYGEWVPVWVTLSNDGADLSGEVIIRVASSAGTIAYVAPVELPGGARKRLPIYVLPNNFTRLLNVQYESEGQALAKVNVRIQPQINSSFFIGLVSPQRGALSLLNGLELPGVERQLVLFDINLAQLPPRSEALRSLDVLILNSSDTSQLTAEQSQAILGWVKQGGRLVIGGGALAMDTVAGLQDLPLPFTPSGTQQISSAADLLTLAGSDQPEPAAGSYIAAIGELNAGARLLAGDAKQPLVVESRIDKGFIDQVALDLSQAPFEGWSAAALFWQNLFGPSASYPSWLAPDLSSRQQMAAQMGYALQNLPMLDLPSVKGLAVLLGVYILVIGPLNYLVLRWKKRLHWAWITIPAITLIFSLSAFGLGYAMHGADIFVNKAALIETSPNGSTYISFIGLFSPAQSNYQIEIPGGGLISPMSPYYNPWENSFGQDAPVSSSRELRLVQSDPALVSSLSIEQWSMQSFMIEGLGFDFGAFESDLHMDGSQLIGEVHNRTGHPLSDVTLVFNRRFQRLGDLPDGDSLQVNLDMAGVGEPTFDAPVAYAIYEIEFAKANDGIFPRELEVKRSMLEALFQWGNPLKSSWDGFGSHNINLSQSPVLVGWLKDAPPQVSVNGGLPAQQSTALVYSQLDYSLASSGAINLPVGLIPGALVPTPMEGGSCGDPGALAVYIYRGEAEFEFYLPAELRTIILNHLNLGVWSDGGAINPPQASFYDFQRQDWVNLDNLVLGENLVPDAANFLAEDGLLRLRISATPSSQGCFYVGLGLDGQAAEQ